MYSSGVMRQPPILSCEVQPSNRSIRITKGRRPTMLRRHFVAGLAAAPLATAKTTFGRDRLSGVTDEMGKTPAEAIEFAHKFGLKFMELRGIPGAKKHYYLGTDEELKQANK